MPIENFMRTLRAHTSRRAAYSSFDSGDLSASQLSSILATLISLEIEEGGPYALSRGGEVDFGLNITIALFLATKGIHLPKLDTYLAETTKHTSLLLSESELAECIQEYENHNNNHNQNQNNNQNDSALKTLVLKTSTEKEIEREEAMLEKIRNTARTRFAEFTPYLYETSQYLFKRTMAGNPDRQMSLMAYYVREALGKAGAKFSDEIIAEFGLMNTFFWAAFIVYDDFWDEDEAANPTLLPVANIFARSYVDFFTNLYADSNSLYFKENFRAFFNATMDRLDMANAWELSTCRMRVEGELVFLPDELPDYKNYEQKYYPAAGHIMGPVALFLESGYALDSQEMEAFLGYFREYLIAMQLNDDAHDWKEDLQRGHLSTAVTELMRAWVVHHPERKEINLSDDMLELEELFWFTVLRPFCEKILAHAAQARAFLQKLSFLEKPEVLEKFIIKSEDAARKALSELEFSEQLLEAVSYPSYPQVSQESAKI